MKDMIDAPTQVFFTAAELAAIAKKAGYEGFPQTESGVIRFAKREGWGDLPSNLCRKRAGRTGGGGLEYHYSLLPERLRDVIFGDRLRRVDTTSQIARVEADQRKLAKLAPADIRSWQIAVRDKRAKVLVSIIGFATRRGKKVSGAITAFLDAQKAHFDWEDACHARDMGERVTAGQLVILQRGSLLTAADGFGLTADDLRIANNRPREGNPSVSRSTLYLWLKSYQDGGEAALLPEPPKDVQPVHPGFAPFLKFYARPAKPSIESAMRKYLKTNPSPELVPTVDQVRYALRVKMNHIERAAGREGPLTLRSRMAYIQRDTRNLLPTTVYTADGKTFDAEIEDPASRRPIRPEITSILDVATRKCVGFAISRKENVMAVTEALRNACASDGICAVFYVDRGPGYKNKRFDDDEIGVLPRLSITKMHALPYNSQAKGIIERFNRTCWNDLAKDFPTYLGADMDKEAKQRAYKESRRELREVGYSRLLMSWDDFHRACAEAIDEYNNRPQRGLPRIVDHATGRLRHMTPNEVWADHVLQGFEPCLLDPEIADDLYRPYVERQAFRCIVEWNTNKYFAEALNPYHEQKVLVGYDDAQADKVWVREIDRNGGPGKLICVAEFSGNKTDYIAKTAQAAAEERRAKGVLQRIDRHREDALAERDLRWLEHQGAIRSPFIDLQPDPVPAEPVLAIDNTTDTPVPPAPKRRTFASDAELAAWALENPNEMSSRQADVLRRSLGSATSRELLRLSGIDTEALRTLLRAAA